MSLIFQYALLILIIRQILILINLFKCSNFGDLRFLNLIFFNFILISLHLINIILYLYFKFNLILIIDMLQ